MRFYLIIGALGLLCWYAYKKFTGDDVPSVSSAVLERVEKKKQPEKNTPDSYIPQPAFPVGKSPSSSFGLSNGVQSFGPRIVKQYRFKYRNPPELNISAANGNVYLVDSSTRTVHLDGSPEWVDSVFRFLESIDLVPGSCAVQTWAVFVDRGVVKGFDLAAAIGAVAGLPDSLRLDGSGLALDLTAGQIAAALSVVADGSVVEVVQRPHIRLEHQAPALVEAIQEVPVPTTSVSQGIAQTSIEYRKVGLQMEIKPEFLGNDQVRLGIKQSNGLIGQTVRIADNEIPVIQSQMVATTTTLTVGQTVILGGVATLRERVSKGVLRNQREISSGSLYVILSTSHDVPKAFPLDSPALSDSRHLMPFSAFSDDPPDSWLDGELLPSKDWKTDESKKRWSIFRKK